MTARILIVAGVAMMALAKFGDPDQMVAEGFTGRTWIFIVLPAVGFLLTCAGFHWWEREFHSR